MLRSKRRTEFRVLGLQRSQLLAVIAHGRVFQDFRQGLRRLVLRTFKLRLEADNPGMKLLPDMFVDLEFLAEAPVGISVPAEAVLDSGLRKIVYLQTADNIFEQRPVEVGTAFGDRITITRGLSPGDRIVSSGNFLLDSESRIRNNTLHTTTADQSGTATAHKVSVTQPGEQPKGAQARR